MTNADQSNPTMQRACEFYSRAWEKVKHEDDLVNQRLTWLVTLHGLLFTAYGFSISAEAGSLSSAAMGKGASDQAVRLFAEFHQNLSSLRLALAALGVLSSAVAWIGVLAAFRAIRDIASEMELNFHEQAEKLPLFPHVVGTRATTFLGMSCGLGVPIVTFLAWIWVGKLNGPLLYAAIATAGVLVLWTLFFLIIKIRFRKLF